MLQQQQKVKGPAARCQTCGGEWDTLQSAYSHGNAHPDHLIGVLDASGKVLRTIKHRTITGAPVPGKGLFACRKCDYRTKSRQSAYGHAADHQGHVLNAPNGKTVPVNTGTQGIVVLHKKPATKIQPSLNGTSPVEAALNTYLESLRVYLPQGYDITRKES